MTGALCEALARACADHAGKAALIGDEFGLRYDEIAEQAKFVREALLAAGMQAHEPVHAHVSNQPHDIAAILGIWMAGGVVVPVHRTTPSAVADTFARRTQARFLVDKLTEASSAPLLVTLAEHAPPARDMLQGAAFVIFTSGSTGAPKAVVVSHDAFFEKIRQIQSLLRVANSDRTLLVLNLTFSFGWWVSLLTLFCGATLVMRSRFEPAAFLRTLIEQSISRVGMVPTMMRVLFSDAGFDAAIARANEAANLRQIWIGGEALGASLGRTIRARFSATELVDIYGLTETATCDFFAFPADYDRHPGSIGRPSPNVQFRISAEGELQLRTPYLMKGYLDEPELTAAALQDGWFRTGDLARSVTGGMVELQGRLKEVISRAGNKVTPAEIEQALCAHPDVAAAMAVGVPDAVLGERIHVLLVARVGASLSVAALRRHLETRLERYKYPDAYYIGDALPLGRTGKVDRAQLRTLVSTGAIAPLSP